MNGRLLLVEHLLCVWRRLLRPGSSSEALVGQDIATRTKVEGRAFSVTLRSTVLNRMRTLVLGVSAHVVVLIGDSLV